MAPTVLITLAVILLAGLGIGLYLFWKTRQLMREAKNYERGLKMVPLLIHLPPISDDVEDSGRDARDVVDENISKAQVMYNIIASIGNSKKGFKAKFYGQRHISFEIVAQRGTVAFYTAVPVSLVSLVEQAVVSAYPSARLEEVAEHNIFSPVGKISGTIGGELVLKESFAYPISTYQDSKRDAMQTLLNALSTLEKEDGVGVQILLRPAHDSWRKVALSEAGKRRKGQKSKKGGDLAFWWLRQVFVAPVKPPEDLSGKSAEKAPDPVSSIDASAADAIEDKTRQAGYEILVRVIASSNLSQRSQALLSNTVATFSLFDAPGKNGFKFVPAKDIDSFVTSYILRFFPAEQNTNILNVTELATIFHFPDSSNIPTTGLTRQASKQVDGPRNLMEDGLLLGYNEFRGAKKPIRLSENDRRRHMYVVGQTGTGKSTFLENLALQDMLEGRGFAFVDPHGDTAEKLLGMVPKERTEDVIYFCPSDMDYPLGLNLFEYSTPEQKDFLIQEVIGMLYKLYDPQRQGIIGPRYEHIFRNCALLLMSDPAGGTFIDIPKLLIDNNFMKQKLKYVTDQTVLDFWTKEYPNSQRSNESGEVTSWVVSKFGAFMSNGMMRNIIGQTKSSFDMREIMDEGKILLVNLSKGRTGELNSKLLGMIFVMKFQAAAMSRANIPEEQRKDFSLYVDEFQNITTDSFADIMSEARKYRLNLIVANQFITQLSDQIRDAIFGNMGTVVAHRVGTNDAEQLVKQFQPIFDIDDLQQIPNYNSIVRMLIGGVPTQPFSMANLPMLGHSNPQLLDALKQLSAAKFGRPKAQVEAEIFARLKTEEPPKPSLGTTPGSPFGAPKAASGGSSFLDEWLAKRKATGAATPAPTAPKPVETAAVPPAPVVAQAPTIDINAAAKNVSYDSEQRNISSPSLDSAEASSIADKIKQQLGTTGDAVPAAEVVDEKPEPKKHFDGELQHDDTIYIDKEGNLKAADDEKTVTN